MGLVSEGLTRSFDCALSRGANLKILAVFRGHKKNTGWGAHMEIIGVVGFVFAATAAGVLVYERQTDVLHGPYIEGRGQPRSIASIWDPVRALVEPLIERLNWNARNAIYLASLA